VAHSLQLSKLQAPSCTITYVEWAHFNHDRNHERYKLSSLIVRPGTSTLQYSSSNEASMSLVGEVFFPLQGIYKIYTVIHLHSKAVSSGRVLILTLPEFSWRYRFLESGPLNFHKADLSAFISVTAAPHLAGRRLRAWRNCLDCPA
jgi:hypothetical protein